MKRKILIWLAAIFCLTALVLFIYFFNKGDSSRWQVALGGIGVSALPLLLLIAKKIPFNIPIIIGYYIAILCTTFLGSIASFYLKHKWWDSTLHFYKGILVSFVGIALYKLLVPATSRIGVSRLLVFLFTVSLAVTSSVIWEIYEYVGDLFFTHTMQLGGNKDTMLDLLAGTSGGLAASLYSLARKEKL
ncbi:membrane-spanning protein [Bacillus sp. FJAT-27225]|uniref:membrane-spanning protein n=1 Tax=Bacillus sp. FJAT-27225 TaxID=1743144 RepID=UPI00080C30AF|nr:membrane-spanning protein [Bacillus sp. FJAT-27225]OCA84446.1 membrane-spanning protein [Bacillus sp. FJAT-27225]